MKQSIQKQLLQLQSRHGWKKSPFFICEGLRCCREAYRHRRDWIDTIVYATSFNRKALDESCPDGMIVSDKEFAELADTEAPQGVLFLMHKPTLSVLPDNPGSTVIVLDRLADPGNVGTILRTAWAMGIRTVFWTSGTCHPFGTKVVRAGMGAQFVINLFRIESVAALSRDFPERTIWITSPRADTSSDTAEFDPNNSFIVLGNEAGGAEQLEGARCVKIPMPGDAESLNVAQAATIFMYEACCKLRA